MILLKLCRGYIAPELVHNGKRINVKSDIYSLGIIIIEILTGQKGYPDVEDVRINSP
jgi:serine/threonine protein kinase